MPYIEVFVDSDTVLNDIDTDDIAAELISRNGWQDAISKAMSSTGAHESIPSDELEELLRDFYFNFPIEHHLRWLCIERLGLFPSSNQARPC